jgi:hypothetical protein
VLRSPFQDSKRSKPYSKPQEPFKVMSESKRKQPTGAQEVFVLGGILSVLGVVALFESQFLGGLFLLGLGIVFMGSGSKEFRKKIFEFFFSIYKALMRLLSPSK